MVGEIECVVLLVEVINPVITVGVASGVIFVREGLIVGEKDTEFDTVEETRKVINDLVAEAIAVITVLEGLTVRVTMPVINVLVTVTVLDTVLDTERVRELEIVTVAENVDRL